MKKVLLTAIDSFTGKHLHHYLQSNGYDVYGTSLLSNDKQIFTCDITQKNDIQKVLHAVKPDYIIHLAGISFVGHGTNEDFYRINTIGSINILDALLELNMQVKKILLVSSATVYGNQNREILDESLCPVPANHYGASKYAMESLAHTYFNKLPIIITRPFNYTGVGQDPNFLIPKIVSHFKEKKSVIELGNLNVSREFNDVAFLCEAYRRLLESDIEGECFNIASGRGIALMDVIEMMQAIAGYNIEIKVNPAFVRKNEIKSLTGSSKKLFDTVGRIDQKAFSETLKDMFEA